MTTMKYGNHFFRDYLFDTPVDKVVKAYKAGRLPRHPAAPVKHYSAVATGTAKTVTQYSHLLATGKRAIPNYRRG